MVDKRGKKDLMDENDKKLFNNLNFYEPIFFQNKKLKFNDTNYFAGFGWSHNLSNDGIWSEGSLVNLLFKIQGKERNIFFEMDVIPFVNEKNKQLDIEVYVNGQLNNKLKFVLEENSLNKKTKVNFKINRKKYDK